jgi:hypothetical protein
LSVLSVMNSSLNLFCFVSRVFFLPGVWRSNHRDSIISRVTNLKCCYEVYSKKYNSISMQSALTPVICVLPLSHLLLSYQPRSLKTMLYFLNYRFHPLTIGGRTTLSIASTPSIESDNFNIECSFNIKFQLEQWIWFEFRMKTLCTICMCWNTSCIWCRGFSFPSVHLMRSQRAH